MLDRLHWIPWLALTLIALGALLLGEWHGRRRGVFISKPLASAGFVGLAISLGALTSPYGRVILIALLLGWFGDVFLIGTSHGFFLAGLVAFLASHFAYGIAFVVRGVSAVALGAAIPVVALLAWRLGLPLVRRAERSLRWPARAYLLVISGMLVLAVGTSSGHGPRIPLAATAFFFSDLAVARQRFIAPGRGNRMWGLPLYYGAQLLFASTVA